MIFLMPSFYVRDINVVSSFIVKLIPIIWNSLSVFLGGVIISAHLTIIKFNNSIGFVTIEYFYILKNMLCLIPVTF